MATERISSATSGSAWITTSVRPLLSRATSSASSIPEDGPTRDTDSEGEETLNQIRSLWNRRTSAIRQRSNSSPSVRESRQAAAKALGRVATDEEGVEPMDL
jgi:hypothetical protein